MHEFKKADVLFDVNNTALEMKLWIASTSEEQETGLMYRKKLEDGIDGMLFVFPTEDYVTMWMKNTIMPLDMIFFDKEGRVVCIKKNAVPESLDLISCQWKTKYVLEVPAGDADKKGFSEAKTILHIDENKFLQLSN